MDGLSPQIDLRRLRKEVPLRIEIGLNQKHIVVMCPPFDMGFTVSAEPISIEIAPHVYEYRITIIEDTWEKMDEQIQPR